MRINNINDLLTRCTGCAACGDACPTEAIRFVEDKNGFFYPKTDLSKCVNCGKCHAVCPLIQQKKQHEHQNLFSAIARNETDRTGGSSGGVFGLLAKYCLENGYYICGAMFDGMMLKHDVISSEKDLHKLLKSKYIQSNTVGIYSKIQSLLKSGEKVFFCGTPCQVAALKNSIPKELLANLFSADIICHGVPSQKLFDLYIEELEKKHGGKVRSFEFRVKDNQYKHAHGFRYVIKCGEREKTINGVYTQSSFYNAFKKYIIFREGCYNCEYATLDRVSDITLGDFWGIEKYQKGSNTDKGVSMVVVNTEQGRIFLNSIKKDLVIEEFPVKYGVELNHCLTKRTARPKLRDKALEDLSEFGYEYAAKKYFSAGIKYKLYWLIPPFLRIFLRRVRG